MKNKIINWKLLRFFDNYLYLYYELDINIDCLKNLRNWLYKSHPFIPNKRQYLEYCCMTASIPRSFITNPFKVYKSNLTDKYYILSKYSENKYPTFYDLQSYLEQGAVLYNSIIDIDPDTIIYKEGQISIDSIKLKIDIEIFYRPIDLFIYIWKYY